MNYNYEEDEIYMAQMKEEDEKHFNALDKYRKQFSKETSALSNVIGLDVQKSELLDVINWFENSKELKSRGVTIPRGCILFGPPGNGKSLLIKELTKIVNCPVFVLKGDEENVVKSINDVFFKARVNTHSIVVIDELDLLINKERRVIRALQENLDGIESYDDILVLAATNDIDEIPEALKRNGRLEKIIHVSYPEGKDAVKLLKSSLQSFNVEIDDDIDENELEISLHHISCVGIQSIANNIVLRNNFTKVTSKMIDESIFDITNRIKHTPKKDVLNTAIHEAGHALMASKYKQFYSINSLNIDGSKGCFSVKPVEETFEPFDKSLADIQVAMAGILAEKVIFKYAQTGSMSDLERASDTAYSLVSKLGYCSCWETLVPSLIARNNYSERTLRRVERKVERILKKAEKSVLRFLKHNKKKLLDLGNLLFEKKHLKSNEILNAIN